MKRNFRKSLIYNGNRRIVNIQGRKMSSEEENLRQAAILSMKSIVWVDLHIDLKIHDIEELEKSAAPEGEVEKATQQLVSLFMKLQLEKENVIKIEKQLDAYLGKSDKKHLSLTFKK